MPPRRKTQATKGRKYKVWTTEDLAKLKKYSREKTPVATIAKDMKRSEATIRAKAHISGMKIGHMRRRSG